MTKLDNGGEFNENYAKLMNLKFEIQDECIQVVPEDNAGAVRVMVCETINTARIQLNPEAHRFEFNDGKWVRASTYSRNLKNSVYDFKTGKLSVTEKVVPCLGGNFNLEIPETNIVVSGISISDGFQCWIWVCHPNYKSGAAGASTAATPDPSDAVNEIE